MSALAATQEDIDTRILRRDAWTLAKTIALPLDPHPYLEYLASGNASPEEWKRWGIQRYQAAEGFLNLLSTAYANALHHNLTETTNALGQNIADELGYSFKDNRDLKAGGHGSWRKDFYAALGIDENVLHDPSLSLPETLSYAETVFELSSQNSIDADLIRIEPAKLWHQLGALLALEFAIPTEFKSILKGMDATPHLRDKFNVSAETDRHLAQKRRLYIQHHAYHDIEQHLPELWQAIFSDISMKDLIPLLNEIRPLLPESIKNLPDIGSASLNYDEAAKQLVEGAEMIKAARKNFYDGLARYTL